MRKETILCDRCGEDITDSWYRNHIHLELNYWHGGSMGDDEDRDYHELDLCHDCARDLSMFIKKWKKTKKMTMEDNNMENTEDRNNMIAYKLAMELYKGFFNTLMEAVENSIKNFDDAQLQCMKKKPDELPEDNLKRMMDMHYYKGKADAFRELSERIQKEYDLSGQDLKNYLELGEKYSNWPYFVYKTIKETKNIEVDRIFPDNDFRCRRVYDKVMRMKGQIANLLEYYGCEGFRLGKLYEKNMLKIKDVDDFEKNRLYNACVEAFIPEDYRDF